MSPQKEKQLSFKNFISTNIWLLKIYWKYSPFHVLSLFITSSIMDIQGFIFSYIFAKAIDRAISISNSSTKNPEQLIPIAIALLTFYLITNLISRLYSYTNNVISISSDRFMRINIHAKLAELGIQSLESPDVTNLIERSRNNLHHMLRSLFRLSSIFGTIITLITTTIALISFAPVFIPIFLVVSLPLLIIDKHNMTKVWQKDKETTEIRRRGYDAIGHLMSPKSLQELIITNGTSLQLAKFELFIDKWVNQYKKMMSQWHTLTYFGEMLRSLAQVTAYIYIFNKFIIGKITVGSLTFMIQAMQSFSRSVVSLTLDYTSTYEQTQRVEEIKQLFDMKPAFKNGDTKMSKLNQGPSINFNNVSFIYPKARNPVIRNLNLNIKSGEKIAIVGHNGAGKTTVVKLICRFYQVSSGSITVNNININELDDRSYYQNLSVLFQDFNTYPHLTAAENIFIGDIKKSNKKYKVIKAAKKADAHEFIQEYKNKYNQVLSERYQGGTRPSTGQWQKLAIARFFYRNTPLVIFDEPTAAIDAESEKRIFNKIYKFFKGKTVIIISHRFSTVRNADRIIVMDHGQIIEHGSHKELMMLGGKYAKAFKLQAEGYSK